MSGVRVTRLPLMERPQARDLSSGLRQGAAWATAFLEGVPQDGGAWTPHLDAAAGVSVSVALAEKLAGRQQALGAGGRAEANARDLAQAGSVVVVTGQQPGLLGGPLLTLHKVAGALSLARRLDTPGGRRVIPVFWLASDDHDLDEANRAVLLDRKGQARRLSLPVTADGRSLRHVEVPEAESQRLEAELAKVLPATPRAAAGIAGIARRPGESFAAWCARALLAQLGDSGLVLLEPELLEPWLGPELVVLAEQASAIASAISAAGESLRAAGLSAPLAPAPNQLALFLRDGPEGPRRRLSADPEGTIQVSGAGPLTLPGLCARLRSDPASASPDAVGRVFVQNALLPVVAYIAGPTEIAYLAQVRRAHQALGRRFPLALPRPTATWIDAKTQAALDAFGWSIERALAQAHAPAPPLHADAALEAVLSQVDRHLRDLPGPGEGDLGARTQAALERALESLEQGWQKARQEILRASESDAGVGRARWVRAWNLLRPLDRVQERTLCGLSLSARYGPDALRQGASHLDPLQACHFVLAVGDDSAATEASG